jgi:hypothetical protein
MAKLDCELTWHGHGLCQTGRETPRRFRSSPSAVFSQPARPGRTMVHFSTGSRARVPFLLYGQLGAALNVLQVGPADRSEKVPAARPDDWSVVRLLSRPTARIAKRENAQLSCRKLGSSHLLSQQGGGEDAKNRAFRWLKQTCALTARRPWFGATVGSSVAVVP